MQTLPAPPEVEVGVARPLRETDLYLLDIQLPAAPSVARITDRHHALARMLAMGADPREISATLRIPPARLAAMRGDPALEELVEFYRERVNEQFFDVVDQLAGISRDVIAEIRERLDTAPEEISMRDLNGVLRTALDRTGHGPTSKQETSISVELGERLEAARRRARDVIDAQVVND